MRKILLIGCNGQVGWELRRSLQCLGVIAAADMHNAPYRVDLSDHASIRDAIKETAPDIIINAAAYTAVDKAESDTDAAMQINGIAPGILAEEAARRNALLVHYSTDYVFNGKHHKPYTEEDVTDPRSVYGETKLAGDQAIQQVGGRYLIFRTSWVYGLRGQNFLLTMRRLAKERNELRVVSDQIGAPTWCRNIADATAQTLAQVHSPLHVQSIETLSGIYNLTNDGHTNWCEFAQNIVARSLNPPVVLPISTAEYPVSAPRPAYSVLSNDKLARTFGVRLPAWDIALDLCLSEG
jgi:dTDP-4-dehydrorhamnose reductase